MDFVAILRSRESVPTTQRDSALARRASYKYPDGVTPIAEYWLASAENSIVVIFSADTFAPIQELQFEWTDVFDVTVFPAVSAEEGLRIGPEVFARLPRMQHP
jgi:hypothetical protein